MTQKNTAHRLIILLQILDEEIDAENLIGIVMWSDAAWKCMLHIEVDNGL